MSAGAAILLAAALVVVAVLVAAPVLRHRRRRRHACLVCGEVHATWSDVVEVYLSAVPALLPFIILATCAVVLVVTD